MSGGVREKSSSGVLLVKVDKMSNPMRTIVLKIYNPSKRKKNIMDEALLNYSKAFQYLLDRAYDDLEYIEKNFRDDSGKYRANHITGWIDKKLSKELNKLCIEPFKDSLKVDFSATLAGFLNLKTANIEVSYPSSFISHEEIDEEYEKILSTFIKAETPDSPHEFNKKINKLTGKVDNLRSIFFCRYSKNRNYNLLYNPKNHKYYAKIYLMNSKNENRKEISNSTDNILIYIDKDGGTLSEKNGKKCFLLFPLSFGRWQESYLKKALEHPEIIKTARLIKRNNEYYLSVNILGYAAPKIEIENYMGVCRGIDNVINYSVVDKYANLLSEGHFNIDKKNCEKNALYKIASGIIGIAGEKSCRIIMTRFLKFTDGIIIKEDKESKPLLNSGQYYKLYKIIEYKVQEYGLPPPVRVSSFGVFNTCPRCGENCKSNRLSSSTLICTKCGMTMNIERLGSLNLARRLIKYNSDTIKIEVQNTGEGIKFINKDIELELLPKDPFNCADEFRVQIDKIIKDFYYNKAAEAEKPGFKKKFSLIKKLEEHKDIFEVIRIE